MTQQDFLREHKEARDNCEVDGRAVGREQPDWWIPISERYADLAKYVIAVLPDNDVREKALLALNDALSAVENCLSNKKA